MLTIQDYAAVTGQDVINHLWQLAQPIQGMKVVHVNSTRIGGGVAEILTKLVPLKKELGIDARWEVIAGNDRFYECTKNFHNGLQGKEVPLSDTLLAAYEEVNKDNAEEMRSVLEEADIVFIHDPQPLPLLEWCPNRKGKWIWRCHIDLSHPHRPVWKYLRKYVLGYDASIFSLPDFAQSLPHNLYLVAPSIDPLSEKNMDLDAKEVLKTQLQFGIDPERPMVLQVSRFDRFKDPVGVIQAYRLAKTFVPSLQLVLAGGGATDDPEGEAVLSQVRAVAHDDPDLYILLLAPDAHRTINALQRAADIVIQKSVREGFGLTVTEGLWKAKPVIGGNTGGIRLQVLNHHTGFLVSTPEGAALRIRYLLKRPEKIYEMGRKAREFVRENFLITRQLKEHLSLMVFLGIGRSERLELEMKSAESTPWMFQAV
ncbi:glycosyltransferase [Desulfomonile tiedjei]|uniref:Glycosyltransferase n=1 Tax=Desulfomonile tiedjei (strain ATCC 49306 / DSM 6799 / DCB-1) TaxID=706587 RepID=I4C3C4_DESTA|nr:glycosyltransferase [Desulfomonile tiedjei]AFM24065.1 glycosyltransferase [Desulfomonile tiedjei DSM 6799]